jgi:DNA-binding transcriptional LysR family regulator
MAHHGRGPAWGAGVELHQIRYFLAASETLNFTRAAERCDVAVPSLTRAIRKLERELGGPLFRRERHLTSLTDLGRLMRIHFLTIGEAAERAQRDAEDYLGVRSRLKLGVVASMPAGPLVRYLQALRARAPEIELHLWESGCEEIAQALRRGEIDLALLSLPEYPPALRPVALCREGYRVAFAPGHRFEAMEAVPLRELEGEAYVKRLHCEFPSNFARLGVAKPYREVRVRYVSEREDWVQAMVAAGLGCTLMPEHLALLPGILTRPLTEPEVHRTISAVTVAGRPHTPPVRAALAALRAVAWDGAERRTG